MTLNRKIWRCRSHSPSHDVKINIRKDSILENIYQNIQTFYFLIFSCFNERKSIEDSMTESMNFANQIGVTGTKKQSISKILALLREKLRVEMHKNWKKN